MDKLQNTLYSTYHRNIDTTPLELLTGVTIRNKENLKLKELLEQELQEHYIEDREKLRAEAKEQILKNQRENQKSYNLR